MKQENIKETFNSSDNYEINVHDDELMIKLGIRPPHLSLRDSSVWTKTPHEKKLLQSERRKHKEKIHFHSVPHKSIPVLAKLIIHLKKNDKFPYTTYSTKCWQHDIPNIISKYYQKDKTGANVCLVTKYTYNGKTYNPDERPFWPGR